MAFLESVQSVGGNMNEALQKKISSFLEALQGQVSRLQRESGLSVAQVGFLKPCSIVIIADPSNIYLVGSNVNAGGVQRVIWAELNSNIGTLEVAFSIVARDIGLEQLFGLVIRRDAVENATNETRTSLAASTAAFYIERIKKEVARSMRTVRINPMFTGRDFLLDDQLFFCLSPFKDPYNTVFSDHICKAIKELNTSFQCIRADNIFDNRSIIEDIWAKLNQARVVISDLSEKNPNVFYETGIAHTIGKEVVLITRSMDDVPFDLKHLRCIVYEYTPRGMTAFEEQLRSTISTIIAR